jgi:hypothetical protein
LDCYFFPEKIGMQKFYIKILTAKVFLTMDMGHVCGTQTLYPHSHLTLNSNPPELRKVCPQGLFMGYQA